MKVETIIERLVKLGYPTAENEFRKTLESPLPDPPYIIWFDDGIHKGGGDFVNLLKKTKLVIELYTDKVADESIEQEIEQKVLYDIEHDRYQAPIEGEDLVQTAYEMQILEKIPKGERNYG